MYEIYFLPISLENTLRHYGLVPRGGDSWKRDRNQSVGVLHCSAGGFISARIVLRLINEAIHPLKKQPFLFSNENRPCYFYAFDSESNKEYLVSRVER